MRAREGAREFVRSDALAVEEPLEIRVRGASGAAQPFVTTMRTPGRDAELAAGLLLAEGVLRERAELLTLERPVDPRLERELRDNAITAVLAEPALARAAELARRSTMGSACGVCGRTIIGRVLPEGLPPLAGALRVASETLFELPGRLRQRQSVFAETGGLHAAGLFDERGTLLELCEDVGRHNALDKLVGARLLAHELPLERHVLLVSGRAGFEIVQKAFVAGIAVVCSVSAPSSLAVELAEAGGITLVGFLRERRFNVYAHGERLVGSLAEDRP